MKKIFSIVIVVALLFLCSCSRKQAVSEEETSATTTSAYPTHLELVDSIYKTTAKNESKNKYFYANEIKDDPTDPYSGYLKRKCENYAKQWDQYIKIDNDEYKRKEFINFMLSNNNFYYFLYDIDGNGTKELILGSWIALDSDSEDYNPPKKIVISEICTIVDGKVKETSPEFFISTSSSIHDAYLLSNGKIVLIYPFRYNSYYNNKFNDYEIFEYKNDEIISRYNFIQNETMTIVNCETNEYQQIEEKDYYNVFNELCGDAKPVDINWKRIDEYGM